MGAFQSKLTEKCQYENDDISKCSSRQPNMQNTQDESVEEEQTTKIIDLNDDCLMKIFEYLDIQALFSVAIANEWLRPAAAEVYKRKTRGVRMRICLDRIDYVDLFDIQSQQIGATKYFVVRGFRSWLLYLRCLGSSISSLEINYSYQLSKPKWYDYVHHYINTYCADSLSGIKFSHMLKVSIDQFVKPFINVHRVSFRFCYLDEHLSQFAKWFPNLRHLRLEYVHLTAGFDQVYFHHLKHLSVTQYDETKLTLRNAANLLDSNRQLRSLDIDFPGLSLSTVLDMVKGHSLITKLTVLGDVWGRLVIPFQLKRIANEHSSLIELNLKDCVQFTADDVLALIDQLTSLKTFEFRIDNILDVERFEANLNQNEWTFIAFDWDPSYLKLKRKD